MLLARGNLNRATISNCAVFYGWLCCYHTVLSVIEIRNYRNFPWSILADLWLFQFVCSASFIDKRTFFLSTDLVRLLCYHELLRCSLVSSSIPSHANKSRLLKMCCCFSISFCIPRRILPVMLGKCLPESLCLVLLCKWPVALCFDISYEYSSKTIKAWNMLCYDVHEQNR